MPSILISGRPVVRAGNIKPQTKTFVRVAPSTQSRITEHYILPSGNHYLLESRPIPRQGRRKLREPTVLGGRGPMTEYTPQLFMIPPWLKGGINSYQIRSQYSTVMNAEKITWRIPGTKFNCSSSRGCWREYRHIDSTLALYEQHVLFLLVTLLWRTRIFASDTLLPLRFTSRHSSHPIDRSWDPLGSGFGLVPWVSSDYPTWGSKFSMMHQRKWLPARPCRTVTTPAWCER